MNHPPSSPRLCFSWIAGAALVAGVLAAPRVVQAQCSSCSAPSLPAGSSGTSDPSARRDWRGWASLHYGYSNADHTYKGTEEVQNSLNEKLSLQMAILTGGVEAPSGTSLGLTLPFASLWRSVSNPPNKTDNGPGDLELRLRQDLLAPFRLDGRFHVALTAGVVAPSGAYLKDPVYRASIGRGVWWALGELDGSFDITPQWAVLLGGIARLPRGTTPDEITWGPEAEGSAGIRFSQKLSGAAWVPKRVSVSLSAQFLWRDRATLKDPLEGPVPIEDVGGSFLNINPSVTANLTDVLFLTISGRIPLWRDVHAGLLLPQLVPNAGIYVSFGGTFGGHTAPAIRVDPGRAPRVGDPPLLDEVAALLVKDRWTVVAYEASWCEACEQLAKQLAAWDASHQGLVELRRVDATHWDADVWAKFLPDATGLPVLDVYGPDGRLRARLRGEDSFRFGEHLPTTPAVAARDL